MNNKLTFAGLLFVSIFASAQVGINTSNPQNSLHIDGAKDNPATGAPSTLQQSNDLSEHPSETPE